MAIGLKRVAVSGLVLLSTIMMVGCSHLNSANDGQVQSYPVTAVEAGWIRNGDPMIFEAHQWFPVDDTESMTDAEMYQVGEFKGAPVFVDKIDTKPYDRLYTKFAKGRFRYYERGDND